VPAPVGQLEHEVAPAEAAIVPAPQFAQALKLVEAANWPAAQGAHEAPPLVFL